MESEYKGAWKGALVFAVFCWLLAGAPTCSADDDERKWPGQEMRESSSYRNGWDKAWGDCERDLPYMYSLARMGWVSNGRIAGRDKALAAGWTAQQYNWYTQGYFDGYEEAWSVTGLCSDRY